MKKKSILIMATILVLVLGASASVAGAWGGCGMWGGYTSGQYTAYSGPYNCPMAGTPGNYYCPRTGNGYCSSHGQYTPSAATTDVWGQYYSYPTTTYGGCW